MGYSKNPAVLEDRIAKGWFKDILAGRVAQWRTIQDWGATRRHADKIHESLYIASLYPDKYPVLAAAKRSYTIHMIEPGLIEARPETPVEVTGYSPLPAGPIVSTANKSTFEEVRQAWIDHMPSQDPLNFQSHTLDQLELVRLYDWCEDHQPRLMMLVGDTHLTVSLAIQWAGGEDLSWKPPAPAPAAERDYDV